MMDVMKKLEPRQEEPDVILFKELDEVNEVLFFYDGTYQIGYELNNDYYFPLQFKNS